MRERRRGVNGHQAGREDRAAGDPPRIAATQHAPQHHQPAAHREQEAQPMCDRIDDFIDRRALPRRVLSKLAQFVFGWAHRAFRR